MLCRATLACTYLLEAIDGLRALSDVSLLLFLAATTGQAVRKASNVSAPRQGKQRQDHGQVYQLQSLFFTSHVFADKFITKCRAYLAMSQPPADSLPAYFCRGTRLRATEATFGDPSQGLGIAKNCKHPCQAHISQQPGRNRLLSQSRRLTSQLPPVVNPSYRSRRLPRLLTSDTATDIQVHVT
jgi:hypothetical protein